MTRLENAGLPAHGEALQGSFRPRVREQHGEHDRHQRHSRDGDQQLAARQARTAKAVGIDLFALVPGQSRAGARSPGR